MQNMTWYISECDTIIAERVLNLEIIINIHTVGLQ
jgi:hypothetical protein